MSRSEIPGIALDVLAKHIGERVVSARRHPTLPLTIYNYTQRAQFENLWDDVTEACRGLIVADSGEIVARPFRKFFNLNTEWRPETLVTNLPASAPEITEKMDGSLGIFYRHDGEEGIATRGSFESEQAAWATEFYARNLDSIAWPEGATPLFEIISPVSRIVVDYDFEGLVLLAVIDNATGHSMPHAEIVARYGDRLPVVKQACKTVEECMAEEAQNFEGYVIHWPETGLRVKVKLAEYLRLHRIITGLSPQAVWEYLMTGEPLDRLYDRTPDEFQLWLNGWVGRLRSEYAVIDQAARYAFDFCCPKGDRKTFALHVQQQHPKMSGVMFKLLDAKPYESIIWKQIRPHGEESFRKDE